MLLQRNMHFVQLLEFWIELDLNEIVVAFTYTKYGFRFSCATHVMNELKLLIYEDTYLLISRFHTGMPISEHIIIISS